MRKFSLLFFLGIIFFHPAIAQKDSANIRKAVNLYEQGKYKADIKFLTGCINKEVNNPTYFYIIGECNYAIGDRMTALQDASWAIKLSPDSAVYYCFRGTIYESMLENRKAKRDFEQAITVARNWRDSAMVFANMGHVVEMLGDTAGAIKTFEMALKLDTNNLAAMTNLAMVLNDIHRTPEAIVYLRKVEKIDSTFMGLYTNLGFCYSAIEQYDKAVECFNKDIKLDPKDAYGYNNRGYAKLKSGDVDGALSDVKKSLKLFPQNSYAYRNLGLIYLAKHDKEKACEAFDKAVSYGFTQSYGSEVQDLQRQNCR